MRIARHIVPGVAYHLIWRFVDRSWFFTSDDERAFYLSLLGRALTHTDWRAFSYALMSNHIHIGAIAGYEPLESWSKCVNSPFARWMNERHNRLGPVIADRPKSHAIRGDREALLIAYIHRNPVRAGVVSRAAQSRWTSHAFYIGDAEPPSWLKVELAMHRTGFDDAAAFDRWVDCNDGESGEPEVARVRKAARRRGAIEVATPIAGEPSLVPLVRRPYGHVRVDPALVVAVVAATIDVPIDVVRSRQRSAAAVAARYVSVHCAKRVGLTGSEIADALGISQAAASIIRRRPASQANTRAIEVAYARLQIETRPESGSAW